MPNSKNLDNILKNFEIESDRLFRLRDKRYNVAVIGAGDDTSVGANIANSLKGNSRIANFKISNRSDSEEFRQITANLSLKKEDIRAYHEIDKWIIDDKIDVIIMAAGPFIWEREKGLEENAEPIAYLAKAVKKSGYTGLTIIVNNPVEPLCYQFAVMSRSDPYSVIGYNPDPSRAIDEIVRYLEKYSKDLINLGNSNDANFYRNLRMEEITGFRLAGAHTDKAKIDGKEIRCRIPLWGNTKIGNKKLMDMKQPFSQISAEILNWINELDDIQHMYDEDMGWKKKASIYHGRVMAKYYLPMIDGEIEGMGPIVWDKERQLFAARPSNFIYHRAVPLSDEEAGITDKVKEQYEDICRYIKGLIEKLKTHRDKEDCWFLDSNEEEEYLKFAKSIALPEGDLKQRAEKLISKVKEQIKKEGSSESAQDTLHNLHKIEEKQRQLERELLIVNLGYLITAGRDDTRNVKVIKKYFLSNLEKDIAKVHSQTEEIKNLQYLECIDGNFLYCRSGKRSKNPESYIYSVNLEDMCIKSIGPINLPVICIKAKNGIVYIGLDLNDYRNNEGDKIIKLSANKDYDLQDFAGVVKSSPFLGFRLNTFDVDEKDVFASSSKGEIYQLSNELSIRKKIADTLPLSQLRLVQGTDLMIGDAVGPVVVLDKNGRLKGNIQAKSSFFDVDLYDGSLRFLFGNKDGLKLKIFDKPEKIFTEEGKLIGENTKIDVSFGNYKRIGLYQECVVLYREDNCIEIFYAQQLKDSAQIKLEGNIDFDKNVFLRR